MKELVLKAGLDGNFQNEVSVILGCAGEALVTKLTFTLPLFDGIYYIDIELPNGQKTKDTLAKNGDVWEYLIPYMITEIAGIGSLQVVVNSQNENGDVIWKSAIIATKVQASINATDFMVNEYSDIFTQIDNKITMLDGVVNNKVDKQAGKGLSTNDYSIEDKQKLASLHNYDDTAVKSDISSLQSSKVNNVIKITNVQATASITFTDDKVYEYTTPLTTLSLAGTEPTDGLYHLWAVNFKTDSVATVITAPAIWKFEGDNCDNGIFIPVANANYELTGGWILNKFRWVVKKWA